jgi:hypothetical protein
MGPGWLGLQMGDTSGRDGRHGPWHGLHRNERTPALACLCPPTPHACAWLGRCHPCRALEPVDLHLAAAEGLARVRGSSGCHNDPGCLADARRTQGIHPRAQRRRPPPGPRTRCSRTAAVQGASRGRCAAAVHVAGAGSAQGDGGKGAGQGPRNADGPQQRVHAQVSALPATAGPTQLGTNDTLRKEAPSNASAACALTWFRRGSWDCSCATRGASLG